MSADNWGICPKCKVEWLARKAAARQALDEQYGKVSREEYKQLEKIAARYDDEPDYQERYTLREDYEHYLDEEGHFTSSYTASCNTCDFSFKFHYDTDVDF